jgi:hypothetical protein
MQIPVTKKLKIQKLNSMFTCNARNSINNMIQHAFSTNPYPCTTLAISSHLSLAAWSPANVLLVPVFCQQSPCVTCPLRPHQCMLQLSPFSSLSAIIMHPFTLNKPIVDKSMGHLLPKIQKFKLCARKILPRNVGVHLCDPKNEGKDTNWPPTCHPS